MRKSGLNDDIPTILQVGECLVPLVMTQCADAQIVSILEVIESYSLVM